MTKKERTIRACRELAAKYREPEGEVFFMMDHCGLCVINLKKSIAEGDCLGCPLANKYMGCFKYGCSEFASSKIANDYYDETLSPLEPNPAFEARAAFFDKIIPILEKIPASRFTKKGWKYFDELDRSW